jgi:drug/metabolite transporter (DMT)-like permease
LRVPPAVKYGGKVDCSPASFLCQENHKDRVKNLQSSKISPQLVLFMGILAASTASIFIRYAQVEVPSLAIAAYRMVLSGLILAPFALPSLRAEMRKLSRNELGLALLSGLFLALHFASWITSLEYTSVASSVVLVTTAPLWLAILAHLLLGERITRTTTLGLIIAFAGGIIVGVSDSCVQTVSGLQCPPLSEFVSGKGFLGNVLALIGAWTGAGYFLIGRRLRPKFSLTSYVFLVYGVAGLILALMVWVSATPVIGFSGQSYLWLLLLAVFPQILGHSSFNWALGHLPAAYISLPLLGEPLISTILALLLLNEFPSSIKIFGGLLILAGIVLGSVGQSAEAAPQV